MEPQFPKWMYHPCKGPLIIQSLEHFQGIGPGWSDTFIDMDVAPGPQASEVAEENTKSIESVSPAVLAQSDKHQAQKQEQRRGKQRGLKA